MLIQELFSHKVVLLTAPPGYGKSTTVDMMKRFLEIDVDEAGKPKDVRTTENYKLFVENNLTVTRNQRFFNEHVGKHPVVFIDFSEITNITNFKNMLLQLAKVQKDTFSRHKYLLNNNDLWIDTEDRELFYTHCYNHTRLSETRIRYGFRWLTELLNEQFDKRVFIFIDKFDTFLTNIHLATHNNNTTYHDKTRIFGFIRYMNIELLKYNGDNLDRALVLGDALDSDIDVYPDSVIKDSVLYEENFGKHFGITKQELEELMPKITSNDEEKENLQRSLHEDREETRMLFRRGKLWKLYGYLSEPPFNKIYSFKPVEEFLRNKTELSQR